MLIQYPSIPNEQTLADMGNHAVIISPTPVAAVHGGALYSTFGDDPDLRDLVTMFVNEIPARVELLTTQFDSGNWEALSVTAHQLKGAAGSYGFDAVTPLARRLEMSVRNRESQQSRQQALDELVALCQSMQSGTSRDASLAAATN